MVHLNTFCGWAARYTIRPSGATVLALLLFLQAHLGRKTASKIHRAKKRAHQPANPLKLS
jgi:hypothetical protein